jgi:hypothetical protein
VKDRFRPLYYGDNEGQACASCHRGSSQCRARAERPWTAPAQLLNTPWSAVPLLSRAGVFGSTGCHVRRMLFSVSSMRGGCECGTAATRRRWHTLASLPGVKGASPRFLLQVPSLAPHGSYFSFTNSTLTSLISSPAAPSCHSLQA